MISALVFSRNRAMQLDALLTSIRTHAPNLYSHVTVLYRPDTADHNLAYLDCFHDHPDITPVEQGPSFERDVREWLDAQTDLVVFHCDDDVFYRAPRLLQSVLSPGVDCHSLRLGSNTFRCHPQGGAEYIPPKTLWRWPLCELDAAYPFSLDGHIYRADLVRDLLEGLRFDGPNDLECQGDAKWRAQTDRFGSWLSCGVYSSVVNIPANRVNDGYANPTMVDRAWDPFERYDPDTLATMFLKGIRIDLGSMDFTHVEGCHQEIPLRFRHKDVLTASPG